MLAPEATPKTSTTRIYIPPKPEPDRSWVPWKPDSPGGLSLETPRDWDKLHPGAWKALRSLAGEGEGERGTGAQPVLPRGGGHHLVLSDGLVLHPEAPGSVLSSDGTRAPLAHWLP